MEDQNKAFDFHLARTLGRTIAELHASLTPLEYREWATFYRYEAWIRNHQREVAGE